MMWPFKHKCPDCERVKEENLYLKGLINSLLVKQGLEPVIVAKPKELTPEEKAHLEKIDKGALEEFGE